jgi:hypothetical protein
MKVPTSTSVARIAPASDAALAIAGYSWRYSPHTTFPISSHK